MLCNILRDKKCRTINIHLFGIHVFVIYVLKLQSLNAE